MADVIRGQVWIMPIGADDIVPVTRDVLSYEHDGALHLAEPIGWLDSDGLQLGEQAEDQPNGQGFSNPG